MEQTANDALADPVLAEATASDAEFKKIARMVEMCLALRSPKFHIIARKCGVFAKELGITLEQVEATVVEFRDEEDEVRTRARKILKTVRTHLRVELSSFALKMKIIDIGQPIPTDGVWANGPWFLDSISEGGFLNAKKQGVSGKKGSMIGDLLTNQEFLMRLRE